MYIIYILLKKTPPKKCLCLAREAGLEPATSKLTASCSTIELLPNIIVS